MPWPVYSERLIVHVGHVGSTTLTVPAGRRIVITEICLTNPTGSLGQVQLAVNGRLYYDRKFQASERTSIVACRCVAYAGELLDLFCDNAGPGATVNGYLFADPVGRGELLEQHTSRSWAEVEALPSEQVFEPDAVA